jgi:hypothetical protein
VRGALDALLQAAANEAGHSISEEIEHRLEASFHGEHIVNMLTGGGNNALGAISRVMQLESDWRDDRKTGEIVRYAIGIIVAGFANLAKPPPPPKLDHDAVVRGEVLAGMAMRKGGGGLDSP